MARFLRTTMMVLATLTACQCEEERITRVCADDSECDSGLICDNGACRPGTRTCIKGIIEEDCERCADRSDCPEGSRCSRSGLCIPPQCNQDADCAQVCQDGFSQLEICAVDEDSGWRRCVDYTCASDSECEQRFSEVPDGLIPVCVASGCRCRNPCGGECPSGQVCCGDEGNEQFGQCIDAPQSCAETQCGLGFEATQIEAGAWSIGACLTADEVCECTELPALPLGDLGIHSDLATSGGRAVIAAYNSSYGDLVIGVGDENEVHWQSIDGVPEPTSDNVTGGPSGPRWGISEPGADVGRYPALTIGRDQTIHVVYQDVDRGGLIYARSLCGIGCDEGAICAADARCRQPELTCAEECLPSQACIQGQCLSGAGRNRFYRIDLDDEGDGAYFNEIELDEGQWPWIVSAKHQVDLGRGLEARLVAYRGQDGAPSSRADFTVAAPGEIAEPLQNYLCQGGCPRGTLCGDPGGRCYPSSDDCDPLCAETEFCSEGLCMERVFDPPRSQPVLANAHNKIVRLDSSLEAVWHDPIADQVMLWRLGDTPRTVGLEGGAFVTMVVLEGTRHLAFLRDETLIYAQVNEAGEVIHEELVDDGFRQRDGFSEQHVMAEPALDLAPDGTLTLYWQDASFQDVIVARRDPNDDEFGEASTLLGAEDPYEGGFGFANRVARAQDTAWFSTYRFHLPDELPDNGLVLLAR